MLDFALQIRSRVSRFAAPPGERWARIPAALLALALAAVFIFGGDRQHFYKPKLDGWDSSKNLALAENLSPTTYFRLFRQLEFDGRDRDPIFDMYGRFPIGGPALIKLAMLPFGEDFEAKILAARTLMLAFYAAAAMLIFAALSRALANRWAALVAALMAFSSYYVLYYSDTVSNEMSVDMFAVALAFHGMVIFVREGRFRQLAVKSCAALLLGWHVYAILLPFIIIGFGAEALALVPESLRRRVASFALRRRDADDGETPDGGERETGRRRRSRRRRRGAADSAGATAIASRALSKAAALCKSRYLALGIITLLFGAGVLGFNFANEWLAYDGEVAFSELPAVQSMIARTGQDAEHNARHTDFQNWRTFFNQQLYRVGATFLPYALTRWSDESGFPIVVLGIAAIGAAGVAIYWLRERRHLLAALAAFGFFWAIPMRSSTAFHEFEGMFYIGIPLVAFSALTVALGGWAREKVGEAAGRWTCAGCAAAALILFAVSAVWMGGVSHGERARRFHAETVSDFERVREIALGKSVFISESHPAGAAGERDLHFGGAKFAPQFYLSGAILQNSFGQTLHAHAQYVLSAYRNDSFAPLTPNNKRVFLYEGINIADLHWAEYESATAGTLISEGDFNIHMDERGVHFAKDGCESADTAGMFHIEFALEPSGVWALDMEFERSGKRFEDVSFGAKCLLSAALPGSPFTAVRAERKAPDGETLWSANKAWDAPPVPPPAFAAEREAPPTDPGMDAAEIAALNAKADALESRAPLARAGFDIYMDADAGELVFYKSPCAPADVRGRFGVNVYPVYPDDLDESNRVLGHRGSSFEFGEYGAVFEGKCMASFPLPDYAVTGVELSQWVPGERSLWFAAAGAPLDAAAMDYYRQEYQTARGARILAATSYFDVHLSADGEALYYVKDDCDEDDTRARFLLSVFPENLSSLAEDQAERGSESLNFSFHLFGAAVDGYCVARRPIPAYPIRAVETGQWLPGGYNLWKNEIDMGSDR